MTAVTVSPTIQVLIRKKVREVTGITSGEKTQILSDRNRIELISIKAMKKVKGFLKGSDVELKRDQNHI